MLGPTSHSIAPYSIGGPDDNRKEWYVLQELQTWGREKGWNNPEADRNGPGDTITCQTLPRGIRSK